MVTIMEKYYDITQLVELVPKNKKILFFCIGTPHTIGDAIGPLVGSYLIRNGCKVYGTIKNPITSTNLEYKIKYVKKKYPNHFIVAIDAAIWIGTDQKMVNKIFIEKKPIIAGTGVDKKFTPIGNISIKGITIVAKVGDMSEQKIQAMEEKSLEQAIIMRNLIAEECLKFISNYKEKIELKERVLNILKSYKASI
jgi:putative sporulation protein YyaC